MVLFSSSRKAVSSKKTIYFHMFYTFVIHYVVGYQVVQSCTCKEGSENIQFLATFPYYNPTTYFLDCITSYNLKKTSTSTGLALLLVLTKVMVIAMAMFLICAVVKAKKISRTIKQ